MKRILYYLWSITGLWFLFYELSIFIPFQRGKPEYTIWILITLSFLLSVVITLVFFRKSIDSLALILLVLYYGIISGTALFILLSVFMALLHPGRSWMVISMILSVLFFWFHIFFMRKKLLAGTLSTVLLVILCGALIILLSGRQVSRTERYLDTWQEKGIPSDPLEIFPESIDPEECSSFFNALEFAGMDSSEPFFNRVSLEVSNLQSAMETGQSVRYVLDESDLFEQEEWKIYTERNLVAMGALKPCTHMQWFKPIDYRDTSWHTQGPELKHLIHWAQFTALQTLNHFHEGNRVEGTYIASKLASVPEKIQIRGQLLLTSLVGMALDNVASITFSALQAMDKKPWDAEYRSFIESRAFCDDTWYASTLTVEGYNIYQTCRCAPVRPRGFDKAPLITQWKPFRRVWLLEECDSRFDLLTGWLDFLNHEADLSDGKYKWKEASEKLALLKRKHRTSLAINISDSYARLVAVRSLWRAVLAQNYIMKYYGEGNIPDSIQPLPPGWPTDPFDGRPLRYRKTGDRNFLVYSIGPDLTDQGGDILYASGLLHPDTPLDIGYHINLD